MAQIVTFPGTRTTPADQDRPAARSGVAADVHSLLHEDKTASAPANASQRQTGTDAECQPLTVLAAQMHKESQELARHLHDLRAAMSALSDVDLPGQARAMVAALGGETRTPRGADATGM